MKEPKSREPLRAEIGSPRSIRLYRGAALVGHVYTADPTFGWRVAKYATGERSLGKQWPAAEDAAEHRFGAAGREAVLTAFAERQKNLVPLSPVGGEA